LPSWRLRVHLYDDRIEAWLGATRVLSHPRKRGRKDGRRVHVIDYRHVIHALRRKPQALAGSIYRDELFPGTAYAEAWRRLSSALPQKEACRRMVALLALAHDETCESELGRLLDQDLAAGRLPDARQLRGHLQRHEPELPVPAGPYGPRSPTRDVPVAHRARQLRRPPGSAAMTAREVDVHKLPAMLTALRLPSFQAHWQDFAERAGKEGWSTARFLAALAECELAERETRRIQRHLAEAKLPGGKTLATFDFKVLPDLRKRGCGVPAAPQGGAASKRSPPAIGSTAAPISSPSAIAAPARPTSCAPSAMP